MTQLFANNAATVLASALGAADTTMTVAAGSGAKFPTISSANDYFKLTLYQMSGQNEINHEVVTVTARAGDVLTIVRAQEGTTARGFLTADPVSLRLTASTLTPGEGNIPKMATAVPLTNGAASVGTAAAGYAAGDHVHPTDPNAGGLKVGDIITTIRPMSAPDYLPANGASYLKSAYPALAAMLPIENTPAYGTFGVLPGAYAAAPSVVNLAASKDGNLVIMGYSSDSYPTFWFKGVVQSVYFAAGQYYTASAISSDGTYMAIGSNIGDCFHVVKRIGSDPISWNRINTNTMHSWVNFTYMEWSSDDKYLLAQSSSFLYVYKRTGDTIALIATITPTYSGRSITKFIWAPDTSHLIGLMAGTSDASANGWAIVTLARTNDTFAAPVVYSITGETIYQTTGITVSPGGDAVFCLSQTTFSANLSLHMFKRTGSGSTAYAYQGSLATSVSYTQGIYCGEKFLYIGNGTAMSAWSYGATFASLKFVLARTIAGSGVQWNFTMFRLVTNPGAYYNDNLLIPMNSQNGGNTALYKFGEYYPINALTEFAVPRLPVAYTGQIVDINSYKQNIATAYIKAS